MSKTISSIVSQVAGKTDKKSLNLVKDIEIGNGLNAAKEYFDHAPWATDGFLKRMVCAPSLDEVKKLGELFSYGLQKKGKFDDKSYGKIVANIPSDSTAFSNLWQAFKYVEDLPTAAAANLLRNVGHKWYRSATYDDKDKKKYFQEITANLVLPYHLAKSEKDLGSSAPEKVENLVNEMVPTVAEKICSFLIPKTLQGHVNRNQHNRIVINGKKASLLADDEQDPHSKPQWYAIFSDQEIDQCHFKSLTNQRQLSRESSRVGNCVYGFGPDCKKGTSHMVAGDSPYGKFSMEITKNANGVFKIGHLDGLRDMPVAQPITDAANKLIERMNNGEIEVSKKTGSIEPDENLKNILGLDVNNSKHRESVFKFVQEARILPNQLQHCKNSAEFMKVSGLDKALLKPRNSMNAEEGNALAAPQKKNHQL